MILKVTEAGFRYNSAGNGGFNNISFSLAGGEILSILGPNGCGKTTLLKCLNNLQRTSHGSITIDGKEISGMTRAQLARVIGYLPQSHRPVFPLSVLDVVLTGRAPHLNSISSPGRKDVALAEEAIDLLGLTHVKNRPYSNLSEGERQLVFLARVLVQRPSVLFLDEPVSHLDFGNQVRFLRMVSSLANEGMSVIITSHFPDHSFLLSGSVALMNSGEFIEVGSPEEVITEKNMLRVYRTRVKIVEVSAGVVRKVCVPVIDDDMNLSPLDEADEAHGGFMRRAMIDEIKRKSMRLN